MPIELYIGVDGSKAGCFFVAIGPDDALEFGVSATIESIGRAYSKARWTLIDIPIGLPSKEIKTCPCDKVVAIRQ